MTTRKKKTESKGPSKTEKLTLNKETLKDLTAKEKTDNVRGGAGAGGKCSGRYTGCPGE